MSYLEMKFKGKKVFVEVDDEGKPIVQNGRAKMKYRLEDDREYGPGLANLTDMDGKPVIPSDQKAAPAQSSKPKASKKPSSTMASAKPPADAIVAYTDGACSGNPGPAGLGYSVVFPDGTRFERGEPLGSGTNNIAELTAILRLLELVEDASAMLVIHTDSEYSIGVLSRGWKAKANKELINRIKSAMRKFKNLQFVKVKGHAGVPENELVDDLARRASETQQAIEI